MQKVYLLLRNNKQEGPYSLEELLSLNLKPYDLIWIEGRSAGWRYPGEIDSLKGFVNELPQTETLHKPQHTTEGIPASSFLQSAKEHEVPGKHIYVSLPRSAKPVEAKPVEMLPHKEINEIRKEQPFEKAQQHTTIPVKNEGITETKMARTLTDLEQDYTNWVFKSRKSKKPNKKAVIIVMVIFIIAAGYLGATKILSGHPTSSVDVHPKEAIIQPSKSEATKVQPVNEASSPVNTGPSRTNTSLPVADKVYKSGNSSTKPQHHSTAVNRIMKHGVTVNQPPVVESRTLPKTEQKTIKETAQSEKNTAKKKKGFGAFLSTVFGKKQQKEKEPEAEPGNTARIPDQLPSERHATHRGETASLPSATVPEETTAPSMEMLEITGNGRSDSWQLGVYDLKLTLHNHNNVPVKTALVNVLYYDENNRLVDRKTLTFTNIGSRGMQTLKAPDQRWADHVDYRIESVR